MPRMVPLQRRAYDRVVSLLALLPDKKVDDVLSTPIDDCRNCLVVYDVQASADKRKIVSREIINRRRESELAVEHGLTVC
jgi:hypothetical protein